MSDGFKISFPQDYVVQLTPVAGRLLLSVDFPRDRALPLLQGYERLTAALRYMPGMRNTLIVADTIRDKLKEMLQG